MQQRSSILKMQSDIRPPLIVILGPTAVGKTEVSLQLARQFDGEIVSADSRLFYQGMDIGTAKPSPEERSFIPHHLIDITTPVQTWSLALFQAEAQRIIGEIHSRHKLPFLVGGTGQYVRAVTEQWYIPQVEPDPALRSILERWAFDSGGDDLHRGLATLDPDAAVLIDPRNVRRTIRALEVILKTGKRFSGQRQKSVSSYRVIKIGLTRPRLELYERIDARIDAMVANGLVDEVRSLLSMYPPDLPPFSAIGYKEIIDYLAGNTSLDEAISLIKRNTRIFVRRQANWFKPQDPEIHWFEMNNEPINQVEDYLRGIL